jgi:arylsulfatase A-like enzyme
MFEATMLRHFFGELARGTAGTTPRKRNTALVGRFFSSFVLSAWFMVGFAAEAQSQPQVMPTASPNILFLFTDDQRHDTIHALGNEAIRTPNIDRLVREGVAFRNAYIMGGSSPAVCSPSRACLMSGRTLWNIECQGEYGFEISDQYKTLPQVFRENGYVTFGTGKNEPGRTGAFGRSFSAGDKILFRGMTKNQTSLPLCKFAPDGKYPKGAEAMQEGKHSAEVYADATIRFIEGQANKHRPFFAYVAFQTPHDPRQCPPEFRAMYNDAEMKLPASYLPRHPFDNGMLAIRDEEIAPFPRTEQVVRKHLADYYAVITHTDVQIGRILAALEKSGKRANTIIVFSSDNGLAMSSHGLMGKQNIYDHSVRVPLIIAGPGVPKGETRDALCYIYDIYPTLCERAGLKTPETVQFQSLNNIIDDAAAESRDHLYFAFMSWQRSIRDKQYKLIEYCVGKERHSQLFDLLADPQEIHNLAGDDAHAATLARLRKVLREERVRLKDGNTPFPFSSQQGADFWSAYDPTSK